MGNSFLHRCYEEPGEVFRVWASSPRSGVAVLATRKSVRLLPGVSMARF
jgi:hypothetical protein